MSEVVVLIGPDQLARRLRGESAQANRSCWLACTNET